MKDRVAALDIGTSKVACLVAQRSETGALGIAAASTVPCRGLKKGVVTDLEETENSIKEVLRDVNTQLSEPVESVVIGIGGSFVEADCVKGLVPIYPSTRQITRDDVMQVVNHSRKQVLPPDRIEIQAIPNEFMIDGQSGIQKPVGMCGGRLEVSTLLVTGAVAHIQNLELVAQNSGVGIDHLVLKPLASGLGVLQPANFEAGVCLVDLGAGTTELVIFENGSPAYSACIPVGASMITSDISKLLKTSPEEAERLKIKHGSANAANCTGDDSVGVMQLGQIHERSLQKKVLCEIIESRMREVAQFVKQHIARSGFESKLNGGVVLTGGGSHLNGISALFEDVLGHHNVRVGTPGFRGRAAEKFDTPEWATAVGLTRFALNSQDDVLSPVTENGSIVGRIKTLWSMISGKP